MKSSKWKPKSAIFPSLIWGGEKIRQTTEKNALRLVKTAKFLSDLLKTDEDIAIKVTQFYRRL